jgi:hypothetical protein
MRPLFAVTSAATDLALLSDQQLRLAAGLAAEDASQDAALSALGLAVAADIATACNVASSGVTQATLRSEAVSDTYWPGNRSDVLVLSRRFVTAIASVVEDGTTLTVSTDYWLDAAAGILHRISSDYPRAWCAAKIIVTYTAGFATVPGDLKGAATDLIQTRLSEQSRDPLLRSLQVNIPDVEERRMDYWVDTTGSTGVVPDDVLARLSRFRNVTVG